MMRTIILQCMIWTSIGLAGCNDSDIVNALRLTEEKDPFPTAYSKIYDSSPVNEEFYYFPEMKKVPKKYWSCKYVMGHGNENAMDQVESQGLPHHLLCQSLAGLANRAVDEGKSDVAVWFYNHDGNESYALAEKDLQAMGAQSLGEVDGFELALNLPSGLIKGYILTDLENNTESAVYAATAAPHENAIIVDKRIEYRFKNNFPMIKDASNLHPADAWRDYGDKCNKQGLVCMAEKSGQLREFAIKNGYFVLNQAAGRNKSLAEQSILPTLEPNAPVYGWVDGTDEAEFTNILSKQGHILVPCDLTYNNSLISLLYSQRQKTEGQYLGQVVDPTTIDYSKNNTKKYVSYIVSDGDNVGFLVNSFMPYYTDPAADVIKMSYPINVSLLSMFAPAQFYNLMYRQQQNVTIMDALGGGYCYVDTYSTLNGRRDEDLKILARRTAAHMRRHRIKTLELAALDAKSAEAKKAYQAYIDANDQLEGIIAVQYAPYAIGGDTDWFVNPNTGRHIPVIYLSYALWNNWTSGQDHGYNAPDWNQGTPAWVGKQIMNNSRENNFYAVIIHAWSFFKDCGKTDDEVAECSPNNVNTNIYGVKAAVLCNRQLDKEKAEVVNIEEMVWRLRMKYYPEETQKFIDSLK